jgi:enoyl-CoA hydratase/carnithine racemase
VIARVAVPPVLNPETMAGLAASVAGALGAPEPRVLVLEGTDGVFCRGLDLEALGATGAAEWVERAATETAVAFAACLRAIRLAGRPTVAVVAGEAVGGGVGVAAACDVVVAGDRATFALPELLFGLAPAIILPLLLERMPAQKVRRLALQGQSCGAAEAQALGLVDVVSPVAELPATLRRLTRGLARAHPSAVATFKRDSAESIGLGLERGLGRGAEATAATLRDAEVRAGIRGFVTEGQPPWAGA